jgi:prepilin-type N-terminal cleavage/methylation domain-containing protein
LLLNTRMGLRVRRRRTAAVEGQRGLTLAELIVVLAVIGIAGAASAPSLLAYWDTSTVQAGARELAAVMNLARQLAISGKTTVCVDMAGTDVRLRVGGCTGTIWMGAVTDGAGLIRISDPATLRVTSNTPVVFTALGGATPSGTYTVIHAKTHASRAVVVAASGRISVQ